MKRNRYLLGWLCLGLLSACSARSLTLDDDRNPPEPGASGEAGPWDCLEQFQHTVPGLTSPYSYIPYVVRIQGVGQPGVAPAELRIDVCQIGNSDCVLPVPVEIDQPDPSQPDVFRITLPVFFDGYLRLTAPGYLLTEYYFAGTMAGNPDGTQVVIGEPIMIPDEASIEAMFADLGVMREPGTALITLRTIDCNGRLADGVNVRLFEGQAADPWVLIDGVPVTSNDRRLTTDESGLAGFVNVPAIGRLHFEGVLNVGCGGQGSGDTGCAKEATYGLTGINIRPNAMTIAEVRPDFRYGR